MALSLNGTTQYLKKSSAIIGSPPISFACWTKLNSLAAQQMLISICRDNTNQQFFSLSWYSTDSKIHAGTYDASSFGEAITTATVTDTTSWHHACAVFATTSSRAAYLDGGNKGTDATLSTPSSLDVTAVGAFFNASVTPSVFLNGSIAFAGIWNVALSDSDVTALAAGYSPLKVQPSGLVAYIPFVGASPETDVCSATGWTVVAAPSVVANPFVYGPAV